MEPKFLIDENLSPRLAQYLRLSLGFDAVHVNEIGMSGASDEDLLARAIAEHRVIMTSNGRDFRKLGRNCPEHPGLAILLGALGRSKQIELGELLAHTITAKAIRGASPASRLFEVDPAGAVRDYSLP